MLCTNATASNIDSRGLVQKSFMRNEHEKKGTGPTVRMLAFEHQHFD